jgi:tripartite ATP-independent transporter DctP family solute receptor
VLPESHPTQKALLGLAEEGNQVSNGSLKFTIIGGGALGGDEDEIQQVITGSLDAAVIQGISLFQSMDKRLAVEEVPFLFESREQAYKAVDGAYGQKVAEILEGLGLHVLAYWENGFRHFTNNVRPIVEPADMNGIKFRSASSEIRLKMFNQLGSSAVPMPFNELFTALQQGTVDGQENPLSNIYSAKFNEVQKYLSLSGHIWNSAVFVINPKRWDGLSDEHKQILQDLAVKYRDQNRKMIAEEDQRIIDELKALGMEVNEVNVQSFREAVKPIMDIYTQENGDELLNLALQAQ